MVLRTEGAHWYQYRDRVDTQRRGQSANVAGLTLATELMRDVDKRVFGDADYTGMEEYLEEEKGGL